MGILDWVDPTRNAFVGLLRGEDRGGIRNKLVEALMNQPKPFDKSAIDGEAMLNNALNAGPSGLLGKIVYHGSPHKFDRFDASKIGTGEGAQAYGHGIYLADAEDVARQYKADRSYVGKTMAGTPASNDFGPEWIAKNAMDIHGDKAADHLAAVLKQNSRLKAAGQAEENKKVSEALALIKSGKISQSGALYKADLPDEWIPKMLDWDKPLSQQPENVRLLAKDLGLTKDATGKDVYSALSNQARDMGIIKGQTAQTTLPGSQGRAAADLSEFGIPGIRYLDGGSRPNSGRITMLEQTIANLQSRGASKAAITNAQRELDAELARASYNYVVFPGLEDKVKILERNGVPLNGLLGLGGK